MLILYYCNCNVEQLGHPLSLDVFENNIYWLARDTGVLIKQDKFGRGVPVIISKNLVNPSGVKGKFEFTCYLYFVLSVSFKQYIQFY